MRIVLVTITLILIAPDVIQAEPFLARQRCPRIAHPVGTSAKEFGQPATRSLFNGRDLSGWSVIEKYDFARHGEITVEGDAIVLGAGTPASGIRIAGDFPRMNYEVTLEAKRIEGSDFFCGLTFPVGEDHLSLVIGGWGGGTTGISNLDGMSAIENQTTGFQEFEQNRWYRIRLRVTDEKVKTWVDDDQIVDVEHRKHKLSIWWEQEPVRPFGIANWYTKSAVRNIRLTRL
ncbi:MAG: DUF1080 domain-containing protein [Planctomycetota bacterium]